MSSRRVGPALLARRAPPTTYASKEVGVHLVAVFAIVVGATYLIWRIAFTLNPAALWLAIPLVAAEVHAFLTFCVFAFMAWDVRPVQPLEGKIVGKVGFFIPTYNEPYSVLAPTIAGACAIRRPHETWVLDDGRRDWVRQLCDRFGVRYVTRTSNSGAKAGNLNHALGLSEFSFVGIVDCDMVPSPDFFDEMLPYFSDERVAIVQGPQEFYNLSSFQHLDDGTSWHEQQTFYKVIQPGKNRWNAAFWCGSPSVIRGSAIREVGGVATETITEDLHTSLRVHRAGWKTVYHHGQVAKGLAPDDYDGFILQRLRWARGSMQVIRREWRLRGLTIAQRLNYIASTGTYFDAYRKLTMLLIPPAILLTDQLPVRAPALAFFLAWAVQFLVMNVANKVIGRGHYRFWYTEMFDFMKLFAFVNAGLVLLVEKSVRFSVTPKGESGRRHLHPFVAPYLALLGLYAVSIAIGGFRMNQYFWYTRNEPATIAAVIWSAAIMVILAAVVVRSYHHITRRRAYRLIANIDAIVRTADGAQFPVILKDLTVEGVRLDAPRRMDEGTPFEVRCNDPGSPWIRAHALSSAGADGRFSVRAAISDESAGRDYLAGILAQSLFPRVRVPQSGETNTRSLPRAA